MKISQTFQLLRIVDNDYCRHQGSSNIKVVWVFFFGWAANLRRSARMPWGPPARRWRTWWMRWIGVTLTRAPCMQRIPFRSHLWTLITSAPDVSTTLIDTLECRWIQKHAKQFYFLRKIVVSSRFSGNAGKSKGWVGIFLCFPYWYVANYLNIYMYFQYALILVLGKILKF